jgi:glycosyltransferase involved in cell wall biosynthesis
MATDVKVTIGIPTYNRASLLRESIASALAQSYRDFRLLICDNASDDETADVVASFADPRIQYVRSDTNIGMVANFNRAIDLTETEFLLLLPDDDFLYPDYLGAAVDVLERHPSVGVVHTAFDSVDAESRVLARGRSLLTLDGPITLESGDCYLERSMQSSWPVCWASALFRTEAVAKADGLRESELPSADLPLLMRVALDWDYACLSETLVACRAHAGSESAALGSFTGSSYAFADLPMMLFERRTQFLDEAGLPEERSNRYRALALRAFRRDAIQRLADRGASGAPWGSTNAELLQLARDNPQVLFVPEAWRLVAAQLGGRRANRTVRRLIPGRHGSG